VSVILVLFVIGFSKCDSCLIGFNKCNFSFVYLWFQLVSVGSDGRILVWQLNQHQKQLHLVDGFVIVIYFI